MKIFIFLFLFFSAKLTYSQGEYWGYLIVYNNDTVDVLTLDNLDTIWVCEGSCVELLGYCAWEASFWHWEIFGGTPIVSYDQDLVVCFDSSGEVLINFYVGDYMDVNDSAGVVNFTSIHVRLCPPESNFKTPINICTGECISFTDSSENIPTSWQWNFEGADPSASTLQNPNNICYAIPGVYSVQQITCNDAGCDTSLQFVTIYETPEMIEQAYQQYTMNYRDSIMLIACATGDNYIWSENGDTICVGCESIFISPQITHSVFTCTIINNNGCFVSCNYLIDVENLPLELTMPNTFTPNGDGMNDLFIIQSENFDILSFQIFDRWGEQVFYTNNDHIGWDGMFKNNKAAEGVYAYIIQYITKENAIVKMKAGNITLIR